jgi:hypothetical protein
MPNNLPSSDWTEEKWKNVYTSVLNHTVLENENVEDFVAGGWVLGKQRSRILTRDFLIPVDVTYALSIFCLFPFKPPVLPENYQYLTSRRWRLFKDAANDPDVKYRFAEVPDKLLTLDMHQLCGLLQTVKISEILQLEDPDNAGAAIASSS